MISLATVAFCLAMAGLLFGLAWPALVDARSHLAIEPEEDLPVEDWPGLPWAVVEAQLALVEDCPGAFFPEAEKPQSQPRDVLAPTWPVGWLSPARVRTEEDWAAEIRAAGALPGAKIPSVESLCQARQAYISRLSQSNWKPIR